MKNTKFSRICRSSTLVFLLGSLLAATSVMAAKPLRIGQNYLSVNPDCSVTPSIPSCEEIGYFEEVDRDKPKAIHTLVLTSVVEGGDKICVAQALIHYYDDESILHRENLAQIYASPGVPASITLTFERPIILEAGDDVVARLNPRGTPEGEDDCRVEAFFGIELLDGFDD